MTASEKPRISRLRIFAGPNGSGKSTLSNKIEREYAIWLGIKVNPDEIEENIKSTRALDFGDFKIEVKDDELRQFLARSTLLRKVGLLKKAATLRVKKNRVSFRKVSINSYFASTIADLIRQKLLLTGKSFSFETVMSHPDKIDFLGKATAAGYRNYLYFITTKDPVINRSRVEARVKAGGHSVPSGKIRTRYVRTMNALLDAIKQCDRAFIFDNSGEETILVAEFQNRNLTIHVNDVPQWFHKYVLAKLKKPSK